MDLVSGKIQAGSRKVGLLAGAFNPPTVAHLALLDAAAGLLDAVACVVPRVYPHKQFFGAGLEDRIAMLERLGYPVLLADRGLLIDIAREFRRDVAPDRQVEVHFVCGRDAAERIVSWDYGHPGEIERQLQEYRLLVAARQGEYHPPAHLQYGMRQLEMGAGYDEVSSTVVRELLFEGSERWMLYVPESIHNSVRGIYRPPSPATTAGDQ